MPGVLLSPLPARSAGPVVAARESRVGEYCLWLLLVGVLVVNLPAFLCMGLDPDATQWDSNARTVMEGGAIYRDVFENNLPGMLVPLVLTRSLLGWSSVVLRLVDCLLVLGMSWQLVRWLPSSATRSQRLGLAGAILVFYLSTSEWCHCQRDVWMLLPALAALSLRRRQVARLSDPSSSSRAILTAGLVEGLLWAVAFWIKPFVAVPALLCWLLSARLARQSGGWKLALDGGAVVAGGLAAGMAGSAWLVATGAWPAFAEIVFVWNREYVVYDVTEGQVWFCLAGLAYRLFPWVLVHFLAVPLALGQCWRALRGPARSTAPLLAGLYLGWLLQSVCLQHLYDYVHVPPIFLGLAVVACRWTGAGRSATRLVWAVALVCVLVRFPAICVQRLAAWDDCVREGSTAAQRDRLTLFAKVSWADLERVQNFLRDEQVKDGEVTCTHMASISLYEDLGVRPATRFLFVQSLVLVLPRQRDSIYAELAASRQRFMVCDAGGDGMEKLQEALEAGASEGGRPSPPASPYAWSSRIVFRSGRYVVLRLSGPETRGWLEAHATR